MVKLLYSRSWHSRWILEASAGYKKIPQLWQVIAMHKHPPHNKSVCKRTEWSILAKCIQSQRVSLYTWEQMNKKTIRSNKTWRNGHMYRFLPLDGNIELPINALRQRNERVVLPFRITGYKKKIKKKMMMFQDVRNDILVTLQFIMK